MLSALFLLYLVIGPIALFGVVLLVPIGAFIVVSAIHAALTKP